MEKSKQIYLNVGILLLITVVNSLLARFGVIAYPIGPGSSGLYLSVAFMIPFTLWFGAWGAIAAYLGCFIGAGVLAHMPLTLNLYWSLADLWQVLIPLVIFRTFNIDVGLRTRRDFAFFFAFGWLLNNALGAAWGATALALGGLSSWKDVLSIFTGWLTGNLIVTIVITPLLLRYVTPWIQKRGLLVRKYWL